MCSQSFHYGEVPQVYREAQGDTIMQAGDERAHAQATLTHRYTSTPLALLVDSVSVVLVICYIYLVHVLRYYNDNLFPALGEGHKWTRGA